MDIVEETATHAWVWTEVIAWMAGTAGAVFVVLAEHCHELEARLTPEW